MHAVLGDTSLHELFGRLTAFDRDAAFIPAQDEPWRAVVARGRPAASGPHIPTGFCAADVHRI